MSKKNTLIIGTVILTAAGFISRIIGFFYRIFLSNTIGAEGMGIYQLISPVTAICFTLTAAGIQTAISRQVAAKISLKERDSARDIFCAGLSISAVLSILTAFLLHSYADYIALTFLGESRCGDLLRIIAYALPFTSIHSCINGYYYGLKKTNVPAIAQMAEQVIRVGATYIIYMILMQKGLKATPALAAVGLVIGEFAAMLFNGTMLVSEFSKKPGSRIKTSSYFSYIKGILTIAAPLCANRLLINVLQSLESVMIPSRLRMYGYTVSESLSIYGILTGMSLPLIFFPSAITNSVSVLLLPAVAEAQATGNKKQIAETIENTIKYCLILGILCTGVFLTFGDEMGDLLFGNSLAGSFILVLGWICPFLYLTTTLTSILNGLGKTVSSFTHNCIGLGLRIIFVLFFIPKVGIMGYLWGLLASELILTILSIHSVYRYTKIRFTLDVWVIKPVLGLLAGVGCTLALQYLLSYVTILSALVQSVIALGFLCLFYGGSLCFMGIIHVSSLRKIGRAAG